MLCDIWQRNCNECVSVSLDLLNNVNICADSEMLHPCTTNVQLTGNWHFWLLFYKPLLSQSKVCGNDSAGELNASPVIGNALSVIWCETFIGCLLHTSVRFLKTWLGKMEISFFLRMPWMPLYVTVLSSLWKILFLYFSIRVDHFSLVFWIKLAANSIIKYLWVWRTFF